MQYNSVFSYFKSLFVFSYRAANRWVLPLCPVGHSMSLIGAFSPLTFKVYMYICTYCYFVTYVLVVSVDLLCSSYFSVFSCSLLIFFSDLFMSLSF